MRSASSSSPTLHPEQALGDARPRRARRRRASGGTLVGGWTTIVWTEPRLAVRSGIARASKNARPASRPPARSTESIAPPRVEDPRGDVAPAGWLGRPGVDDAAHARPDARGSSRVPSPSAPGAPCARRASRSRAGRGTRRTARASRRCRSAPSRTAAIRSRDPTTRPPSRRECPDRYFVADSITRSAPCSSGRHTAGEANVLSTVSSAPCRCAASASARQVREHAGRVGDRLDVEDPGRRGGERRLDGGEVGRVDIADLDAQPPERAMRLGPRRPVADLPISTRSPARRSDRNAAWIAAMPVASAIPASASWSSATASPRAVDRRVVDPAVRVARAARR